MGHDEWRVDKREGHDAAGRFEYRDRDRSFEECPVRRKAEDGEPDRVEREPEEFQRAGRCSERPSYQQGDGDRREAGANEPFTTGRIFGASRTECSHFRLKGKAVENPVANHTFNVS